MLLNDKLKKPVILIDNVEYYSLQLLDYNNMLSCHIRKAQNIVLHNMNHFSEFGVYRNKKGERIRYYISSKKIKKFNEEVSKFKTVIKKRSFD